MKRKWQILVSIIMYIIILAAALEFDIVKLLDFKLVILVILGTLILTLPFYEKNIKWQELGHIFGRKAIEAGFIQTFLMLFARLQGEKGYEGLLYDLAMSFRPLLYGFAFWIFLSELQEDAPEPKEAEALEEPVEPDYPIDLKELGLTKREEEIVRLILMGKSNKEIGDELFISEKTVKKHVSNIFEKTGISRREELFILSKGIDTNRQ